MRVYLIRDTRVSAHKAVPSDRGNADLVMRSAKDLANSKLSTRQMQALWRALPHVAKNAKFKDRKTVVARLWTAFEGLPLAQPETSAKALHKVALVGRRRPAKVSKIAAVVALLRTPNCASLDALTKATGWQRHTVRGAIAGTLKRRHGLKVESKPGRDGRHIYRIV